MGKNNLITTYGTNEKGLRLCKQCLTYKDPSNFYKSDKYPDGKMYKCKTCFYEHKIKSKSQRQKERMEKIKLNTLPEVKMAKMTQCSKEDYLKMYEFLRGLGYDSNGDIGLQFSERHNTVYKPRDKNVQNLYLPDGTKNPLHRTYKG